MRTKTDLERQHFLYDECNTNERNGETVLFYGESLRSCGKAWRKAGQKATCCVTTFGCQMNARDSEKLVGILEKVGYEIIEDENADFVIYNTCTVRDNANQRVYGRLGVLNGYKKKNPHMKIALCGCMMQEPSVIEKIKTSYRFVDLIFGTHNIFNLQSYYAPCLKMREWSLISGRIRTRSWKICR